MSIEHLAADTLLSEPYEIIINGETMFIERPVTSTIIAASKYISKVPTLPHAKSADEEAEIVMAFAGDLEVVGEIMAVLILGHKNIYTYKKACGITYKRIDNVKPLAAKILDSLSNRELQDLFIQLLAEQELGFFLNTTFFLHRANLLRRTKGTKKTEATALGQ